MTPKKLKELYKEETGCEPMATITFGRGNKSIMQIASPSYLKWLEKRACLWSQAMEVKK